MAFVPAQIDGEGINLDTDAVSRPLVVVTNGALVSVLGHEIGHHLGLEHTEAEEGADRTRMMYEDSGSRGRFTPAEIRTVKMSMRARLVAPGRVARGAGPERGDGVPVPEMPPPPPPQ